MDQNAALKRQGLRKQLTAAGIDPKLKILRRNGRQKVVSGPSLAGEEAQGTRVNDCGPTATQQDDLEVQKEENQEALEPTSAETT